MLPGAPLHAPTPDLLHAIMTICREKGIPESRFGREATGDPRLVSDLRRGRELRQVTNNRVVAHMEALRKANPPRKHGERLRDALQPDERFQRVLHALGRDHVENLTEALIDHLDTLDAPADPEAPDFSARADQLAGDPVDAEPDDDAKGDIAWPEWHTRGRYKVVERPTGAHEPMARHEGVGMAHEDDEDDDPKEANGDEHDTGNAEDECLTGNGLQHADNRVGCPISDPGGGHHEEDSGGYCPNYGIDQTQSVSEGEAFHDLNDIRLIRVPSPENDL